MRKIAYITSFIFLFSSMLKHLRNQIKAGLDGTRVHAHTCHHTILLANEQECKTLTSSQWSHRQRHMKDIFRLQKLPPLQPPTPWLWESYRLTPSTHSKSPSTILTIHFPRFFYIHANLF
ncbi:hypothetical protein HanXRQr2_Chr05g0205851 [Helianthus annuus]|uniref:Uncharacterized protein n=1 Tax=Helianthus annuus TaxID=4232 RepID=A0A9K3NLY8_HELAN|nr:hypothetical protein HanXRQr2_Chr05g0205851 [Helianthus annuus]KAJ0922026.1 hypothetical protein HanPSC8_Chr05g0198691 [Helianthus annuus]